MASTPEKKVKDRVKALLKKHDVYMFNPVTSGFGTSGVPDIVACIKGKFIGIEVKAGDNKPTALQEKNLADIARVGGFAVVVNENGLDHLDRLLETLVKEQVVLAGAVFDLLIKKEK
jgi:hypothetical protein